MSAPVCYPLAVCSATWILLGHDSCERRKRVLTCHLSSNRHLIADHLGWFKESTEEGKLKTVEDLMRAKGERVRRGRLDAGGVIEYTPEDN